MLSPSQITGLSCRVYGFGQRCKRHFQLPELVTMLGCLYESRFLGGFGSSCSSPLYSPGSRSVWHSRRSCVWIPSCKRCYEREILEEILHVVKKRLEVPGRILAAVVFVILVLSIASVEMSIIYNGVTREKSLSPPSQSIPLAIGFIVLVDGICQECCIHYREVTGPTKVEARMSRRRI